MSSGIGIVLSPTRVSVWKTDGSLPSDGATFLKEKYVDEEYGYWYEFGVHSDGHIDIVSSSDILGVSHVEKTAAEWLISEHNRIQKKLVETVLAFSKAAPKEFTDFWYPKG